MTIENPLQRLLDLKYVNLLRPRNRIFLLSHMRANTSLFGHIVGSNPNIEGYYELQKGYGRRLDLLKNKAFFYNQNMPKHGANYIFDKILHNYLPLSEALVSHEDRTIFMIREPASTIASIATLFGDQPGQKWSTLSGAEAYYTKRLAHLKILSFNFRDRYFFLKAEDLVSHTDEALSQVSDYLGLNIPLSKHYHIFNKTGERGSGDSSESIKSGTVISFSKHRHQRINIKRQTQDLYQETLNTLIQNALSSYSE